MKILSVLFLFMSTSCYAPYPMAPSISYENMSNNFIREINIVWNGRNIGGAYKENPGGGGSSSFQVRKKSDFYGPVHLSWKNAEGRLITKDFIFTREHLANFGVKKNRATIDLYFTQDDVMMFITRGYNIYMNEEQKALGKPFMGKYSNYYHITMCPNNHKLDAPPCELPIKSDPEWEKISKYYISKYGVESYAK